MLDGIDEFLDDSIVLPPGDWDQDLLLPIMHERNELRKRKGGWGRGGGGREGEREEGGGEEGRERGRGEEGREGERGREGREGEERKTGRENKREGEGGRWRGDLGVGS